MGLLWSLRFLGGLMNECRLEGFVLLWSKFASLQLLFFVSV